MNRTTIGVIRVSPCLIAALRDRLFLDRVLLRRRRAVGTALGLRALSDPLDAV